MLRVEFTKSPSNRHYFPVRLGSRSSSTSSAQELRKALTEERPCGAAWTTIAIIIAYSETNPTRLDETMQDLPVVQPPLFILRYLHVPRDKQHLIRIANVRRDDEPLTTVLATIISPRPWALCRQRLVVKNIRRRQGRASACRARSAGSLRLRYRTTRPY
jgi:hypothetical protein